MITPAQFAVFVSNVNTLIGQAWVEPEASVYTELAQTIPSSSTQNVYGWTGMLQVPRVWTGPRIVDEPAPQTYTLVNLPYEKTVAIDRFHLDDDMMGIYYRVLPDMARQIKRLPDLWSRDLLENRGTQTGSRQNGLDTLTFFNTAHPIDFYDSSKGTYSNDATAGGIPGVGGAFSPTALATLYEYMLGLKGEDLEVLKVIPDTVMIPNQLKLEAELVIKSMTFAPPSWGTITGQVGAADNPLRRFGLDMLINPYLKSATTWYLADTKRAFKPMIWQVREAPRMVPRIQENDPVVFDMHKYLWGGWGRAAPGWGPSWLMARSGT